MKNIISGFIFILFYNALSSQNVVKFIDSETKQPLPEMYGYVYKYGNIFEDCGASCENGCRKFRIKQIDSTATYQFVFNYYKYFPVWKEIDPLLNDTLLIEVKKDPYFFIPEENILYKAGCSHISLLDYQPKVPRSLSDLPKEIAEKVSHHIKLRVGNDFFENMRLIDGQIFEIDVLKKRFPNWKNDLSAYYLCFSYRNLDKGIGMLISTMELDDKGNITKAITLPHIASNSQKGNLISFESAKKIAIEHGFNIISNSEINIHYDKKEDRLIWFFRNVIYRSDNTSQTNILKLNANSGELIETKALKGYWMD